MDKIYTKHFQYTGTDDYDQSLDDQINIFFQKEGIGAERIVDIKYNGHTNQGVATYSALVIYKGE